MHSLGGVDMAVLEMDKKATRRGCPWLLNPHLAWLMLW
jgi:hypothetical protein